MNIKSLLAASTALALVAAAPAANAGGMYVSVVGGANFLADDSGNIYDTSVWSSDADTGLVLGGAIGTSLEKWAQGLKAELEVSYRRNDLGGFWSESGGSESGSIDGNLSTFAVMANVWYDFDVGSKFVPYVGGGAGWARMHGDWQQLGSDTSSTTADISGFAWQLGLGFHYPVAANVDAGLGYRYFRGPRFNEVDFEDGTGVLDNDNHSVMFNLTIGIN